MSWTELGVYALPVVVLAWIVAAARSRSWRRKYGWWHDRDERRMKL